MIFDEAFIFCLLNLLTIWRRIHLAHVDVNWFPLVSGSCHMDALSLFTALHWFKFRHWGGFWVILTWFTEAARAWSFHRALGIGVIFSFIWQPNCTDALKVYIDLLIVLLYFWRKINWLGIFILFPASRWWFICRVTNSHTTLYRRQRKYLFAVSWWKRSILSTRWRFDFIPFWTWWILRLRFNFFIQPFMEWILFFKLPNRLKTILHVERSWWWHLVACSVIIGRWVWALFRIGLI